MGPILRELWRVSEKWPPRHGWSVFCSDDALDFAFKTAEAEGLYLEFLAGKSVDADVLSYAIEAAEALGL